MAQDDGHINADLLALADDDESDSDIQDTKSSPKYSRANSEPRSPSPRQKTTKNQSEKTSMPSRSNTTRRRSNDDNDDAASDAGSLGSGAMSESESDAPPPPRPAEDGPLFPIDGKFKSEEEMAQVMALPEVERESFLADRSEEIQEAAQSAQLRQLMASRAKQDSQKKRKADEVEEDDKPQPKRTAKSKTSENIANYKRLREERNEQRKRGEHPRARNDLTPSPSDRGGDSDRDTRADSEEVEWEGRRRASPVRREPPPTKRDIDRVRVGRSNFHKVCFYPGFEEAITGCFCRVAIGPHRSTGEQQYRMTQIKGFTTGREYKMEANNGRIFKTNQYAILAHGKAEKEWPFIACSDQMFTISEYERYMSTIQSEGLRTPAVSFLSKKCQDITNLLNRSWTDAEITERLRRMNGTENHQNDTSATGSIQPLSTTQESSPRPSPSKSVITNGATAAGVMTQQQRLAALNDRNRRANAEAIRKAQTEERKKDIELKAKLEKGDGEVNPFARVKSKARGMLDVNRPRAGTPLPAEDKAMSKEVNGTAANGSKVETSKPKPPQKKRVVDDEGYCNLDLGIDVEI